MQYQLGDPPKMPNAAFDALEKTFGSSAFSAEDAAEVIGNALYIDKSESINHFRVLLRSDSITPTVPTLGDRLIETAKEVRRPVKPPVEDEDEEDLTIGEMSHEEQTKHFGEIG